MSDLDGPYTMLPSCLPMEIKNLIHLYAGTCTTSCKYIKSHILYIKNSEFCSKFIKDGQTLWACNIEWSAPKYTMRWVENFSLSTQELDLKIAWHMLKREKYFSLNHNIFPLEREQKLTIEWFETQISKIQKVLQTRLHDSLHDSLRGSL